MLLDLHSKDMTEHQIIASLNFRIWSLIFMDYGERCLGMRPVSSESYFQLTLRLQDK